MFDKNFKINVLNLGKFELDSAGGIETVQKIHQKYLGSRIGWFSLNFTKQNIILSSKSSLSYPCFMVSSQPLSARYLFAALSKFRKFDLVHIHLPNYLALILSSFVPRNKLLFHWHSDVIGKGVLSKILRPVEKFLVSRGRHVIFTSNAYRDASYIKHKNSVVIPLSTDFFFDDIEQADQLDTIDANVRFVSVGRLVDYKNHFELIESFTKLPRNWTLSIVGTGPNAEKLKTQIWQLGLEKRVTLHGYLSSSELEAIYSNSDALILWSNTRAEAFGLVLLEAYARGLPIIAYNNIGSGMLDIVENTRFSLCTDNLQASQDDITSLIKQSTKRLVKNDAFAVFSPTAEADKWYSLYLEMMKS